MAKHISISDINEHYALKHRIRTGMYNKPFANFGYWPREGMTIDDACEAMAELIAKELDVSSDDRILECGCGYGATAIYIAGRYRPEKIIGIDVTSIRIEDGREVVKKNALDDRIEIKFGDATCLEFESASFTKLMAIECAFHFDTRYDFFKEAFRVLRPGGIMALTDIIPSSDINIQDYTYDELREFLSADKKRYCDANLYNAKIYAALLEEAGFVGMNIYSIKKDVVLQYADHVLKTARSVPAGERERRINGVRALKEKFMVGGDYVVVRAQKGKA